MSQVLQFETFADALRAARLIRRMSQLELEADAGVSVATIRRHESGSDPKGSHIEAYGRALDGRFVFGAAADGAPAVGFEPTTYRFVGTGSAA